MKLQAPGRRPAILLATEDAAHPCVARIDDGFLWSPLRQATDDAAWTVRDETGRLLFQAAGGDARGARSTRPQHTEGHLFLGVDFGAGQWVLDQATPAPEVRWHGMRVSTWLVSVAVLTVLVVGLIGQSRLRVALAPLEQLTDGVRRLAHGAPLARVPVRRADEIGTLTAAFNDMSTQLAGRLASLRGLAAIDAAILGRRPFADIGAMALRRLAEIHPRHDVLVAWRRDGAQSSAGSTPKRLAAA